MFSFALTLPSFAPLATFILLLQENVAAAEEEGGGSRIFWLILAIFLTALIWWLLNRETSATQASVPAQREGDQPAGNQHGGDHHDADGHEVVSQATAAVAVAPVEPDNLTKVEGIGPKINQLFHAAGINTFADLAQSEVTQLRKILLDAGLKVNDPTTWPEQAALAAAGRWDDLQKLQDQLEGGRRL